MGMVPTLPEYGPGDLDCNGTVDGLDLAAFAAAFGSSPGMPEYRSAADLNNDNIIDETDLAQFGGVFGNTE